MQETHKTKAESRKQKAESTKDEKDEDEAKQTANCLFVILFFCLSLIINHVKYTPGCTYGKYKWPVTGMAATLNFENTRQKPTNPHSLHDTSTSHRQFHCVTWEHNESSMAPFSLRCHNPCVLTQSCNVTFPPSKLKLSLSPSVKSA